MRKIYEDTILTYVLSPLELPFAVLWTFLIGLDSKPMGEASSNALLVQNLSENPHHFLQPHSELNCILLPLQSALCLPRPSY